MSRVNSAGLKQFLRHAALAAPLLLVACTGVTIEPGAGAETVMVRTLRHPDVMEIEYLRRPSEGPLTWKGQAWTLLWLVPLNRPDMGLWLQEVLPADAEAANVRATVTTPVHGHLLAVATLGLVRFQNVEFRADPVRLIPPPAPPALSADEDTTPTARVETSL